MSRVAATMVANPTLSPFTQEYLLEEIRFLGYKIGPDERREYGKVKLIGMSPKGVLTDYLNKWWTDGYDTVGLVEGGNLWMSATRMEIQSQYLAIQRAHGQVGVGGLGLGYVALRCAEKPDVATVTVFERNRDVVDMFTVEQGHRKEFKKIRIVVGDIHKTLRGFSFDYFFNDIYPTLLGDEISRDARQIRRLNTIGTYDFWGQELCVLALVLDFSNNRGPRGGRHRFKNWYPRYFLRDDECEYFKMWQDSDAGRMRNSTPLDAACADIRYSRRMLKATGR